MHKHSLSDVSVPTPLSTNFCILSPDSYIFYLQVEVSCIVQPHINSSCGSYSYICLYLAAWSCTPLQLIHGPYINPFWHPSVPSICLMSQATLVTCISSLMHCSLTITCKLSCQTPYLCLTLIQLSGPLV